MEKFEVNDVTSPASISFLFHVSMWWRIFYGAVRIVLGFVLLKLIGSSFTDIFASLMSHEVSEDSTDAVFQLIYSILEDHSFTVTYFIASYLFFWGAIDIFLSILLLRHRLWAFPTSIALMGLFILYEIYRVLHTHSLVLLWIIIIDAGIVYLIHREYRLLTRNISKRPDPLPRQS